MKLKTKFQDEDFELGEVVDANMFYSGDIRQGFKVVAVAKAGGQHSFYYNSVKDFTDHWEDAPEEPKEYWWIDSCGDALQEDFNGGFVDTQRELIGNKFETKEESEKAVEKLRAWKRLRDKGFKFGGYTDTSGDLFSCQVIRCSFDDFGEESRKDLDLLFGGGE